MNLEDTMKLSQLAMDALSPLTPAQRKVVIELVDAVYDQCEEMCVSNGGTRINDARESFKALLRLHLPAPKASR